MSCCDFTPYADSDEESWHYQRTCLHCGYQWYGLHCPHDNCQNACWQCGARPDPVQLAQEELIAIELAEELEES